VGLAEKMAGLTQSTGFKNLKGTTMLKIFGLTKVPLIFLVNPSVRELTPKKCSIKIPLNLITKNHWGSMYFGTLAIGADCAAGLFAMYKADQIPGAKFSIVFKDFKANFLKRPESDVIFSCTDYEKIDAMLAECKSSGERVTKPIRIEARVPANSDELVAEFELGLSLKASSNKKNN
jgi:hypothetical protein